MNETWWNILGAATIFAVLLASQPLRPQQAAALESRIASTLTGLVQVVSCEAACTSPGPAR